MACGFRDSLVTEVPPGQTVLLKVAVLQDAAQYPLWVIQKMPGNEVDVPEQRGEASGQISWVRQGIQGLAGRQADFQVSIQGPRQPAKGAEFEAIPTAFIAMDCRFACAQNL